MAHRKWSQVSSAYCLTLVTGVVAAFSWGSASQAQFVPPNLGAPRTTAGGGGRWDTNSPSCIPGQKSRALVPFNKVGLTTEDRPTFFLYLSKTEAQLAEFMLQDMTKKSVYHATIPISGQPGIVSFQLPTDAPPLATNKDYQWYFKIICQPSDRSKDEFVAARIKRVEPDPTLLSRLKTSPLRQHPNIYAQAGIWQDTLATLNELRRTYPNDRTVIDEWQRLLKSVELGDIPGEPPTKQLNLTTLNTQ